MSVEQLLSQFDVALPQEVVRDVQASGVPFTREIWGEGTGKRDLLGCIILDKSDQDVVRLKFNGNSSFISSKPSHFTFVSLNFSLIMFERKWKL